MHSARTDRRGEVHLARREADLAHLLAVNIDRRIRIQILRLQSNASANPILGDGDRAFIPSALDLAKLRVPPAWVGVERLVVALHVVLRARPAGGNLVVTPS